MLGYLAAAVLVPLLVALGLAALVALTAAPFVVAGDMAERRGFSVARWCALAVITSAVGLGIAYLGWRRTDLPALVVLLPLALTWAAPGGLWLLEGTEEPIGGRRGAHE